MPQIVDETRLPYPAALRKTLQDVVAHLPPELMKGVLRITVQDAIEDAAVLQQMPNALSQYIPRGRDSAIRLFMGNIFMRYRRRLLIRWRPIARARLIAYAISHALVYHKHKGMPRMDTLGQEAGAIQAEILKRWLDVYPFEPWMKVFILDKIKNKLLKKEGFKS